MDTRRRTHRGLRIAIVVFIIIAVIAAAVFAAARYVFKVKEINITGSDRYSYEELYKYILQIVMQIIQYCFLIPIRKPESRIYLL